MSTKTPAFLYHYTSVETLSLILNNRTIRFNSLCNVDDLTEEQSADVQNFGSFVFVSCWTDTRNESIPMWMMYAKRPESIGGVRIKLPTFPFKNHTIEGCALRKIKGENSEPELVSETRTTFYPYDLVMNGHWPRPNSQDELLLPVEYTDDFNLIKPKVFIELPPTDGKPTWRIDLEPIGRYKPKGWEFQCEWRYRFAIFPQLLTGSALYATRDGVALDPTEMIKNLSNGESLLSFSYVDFDLSDEALENIEITLSPTINGNGRGNVHSIVAKLCPTATIIESSLAGTIRG